MIAWHPTQKYRIEVYPGKFAKGVYNGADMIHVLWDDKSELSGGGSPCLNFTEVEKVARRAIERFNPKLFEDQQLTLF